MNTVKLENIRVKEQTAAYVPKNKDSNADFRSAGIKIGLCIALCIALCIVNLTVNTGGTSVMSGSDSAEPGKLRFVELPGIIEVFAGGDKLTMPVSSYESARKDENNLVTFICQPNATVTTCSSGTVKAVGTDEKYGNYVVILHGDIETYYYGLGYITVEERQVINTLDTLGLLSHDGILYFKICKNGKAQEPTEHLPIRLL